MKKVYLIQYNASDSIYFESRVKNLGDWVKYFSDNYIIVSELDATQIYDQLTEEDDTKSILIIQLDTKNYYGRMNTKVWDFLKKHKVLK
ncbi:hypothetical protein A1704_19315 [Chryseobacterium cucumeris]|uniref:hypothetical protein n=1 Tax=Chryseobacterium TaxID=59732 RepID=UPI0007872511|nr:MULTISPECIES: hypothetical protein [Chryseobacterium]KYH03922.1 hypothetical protein A1704_19315 [Chryseobacterium cucumeris]